MIPFLTLDRQVRMMRAEILEALAKVVDRQAFSSGPFVEAFEEELATYLGVEHVVGVNNGTTALHAALVGAGVGPGDEVLTVAHTWISTAWAITYAGAVPRFVDVDRRNCGIDPDRIENAITPRTRAILPVHLYGLPVEIDAVAEIAARRGLALIEDCAQSIGASFRGAQTGTFGILNATSFYPGKNLGALGEGGAVITADADLARRVRRLRDHAQEGRHHHVELGFNWRMDGFQGAVLSVKLKMLDKWNNRRRAIALRYLNAFRALPNVTCATPLTLSEPIWHIFPIFHAQRDLFRAALERRGVQSGVHYPTPVHLQPAYAYLGLGPGALPVSEELALTEISLPMFPELSDSEVDQVIAAVVETAAELA